MVFVGKGGVCKKCNRNTIVVSKGLCKECYMFEWNNRRDIKKMKKKWERDNKFKRKLRQAGKFILTRTNEFVPINLLKEILERDNYTCQYCGSKRDLSFDHKIPISKGGTNSKKNIVIACCTCNAQKSNMSVKKFKKKYKECSI